MMFLVCVFFSCRFSYTYNVQNKKKTAMKAMQWLQIIIVSFMPRKMVAQQIVGLSTSFSYCLQPFFLGFLDPF